jgi:hypothetical protein
MFRSKTPTRQLPTTNQPILPLCLLSSNCRNTIRVSWVSENMIARLVLIRFYVQVTTTYVTRRQGLRALKHDSSSQLW